MLPFPLVLQQPEPVFFRWIAAPQTIYDHVGESLRGAGVSGLSDDGRILAGTWTDRGHSAYRWTEAAGAYTLPWDRKRMGYWHRSADALSADGLTVGGTAIWTQYGTPLYKLRRKTFIELWELGLAKCGIRVTALSRTGDGFGGEVRKPYVDADGQPDSRAVGFVWRKGLGHRLIEGLSSVSGVSADGTTAVGRSRAKVHPPAVFVWPDKVTLLPLPKGSTWGPDRVSMSGDGRVVVGNVSIANDDTHDPTHGVVWRDGQVAQVLPANVCLYAVSPDGTVSVGYDHGNETNMLLVKGEVMTLAEAVPEIKRLGNYKDLLPSCVSVQESTVTIAGGGAKAWIVRFPRARLSRAAKAAEKD